MTFVTAVLIAIAIEYGSRIRADGGGDQSITLTSIPSTIVEIEFVAVRSSQSAERVAKAFCSEDRTGIFQWVDPTKLKSLRPSGTSAEISIRQQWSSTERGFKRRPLHYTQSYQHLVLNLVSADGSSKQLTIDLPEYCGETSVDLSRSPEN